MKDSKKQLFHKGDIFEDLNPVDPNKRFLQIDIFDIGCHPRAGKIHARYSIYCGSTVETIGKHAYCNSIWIPQSYLFKKSIKYIKQETKK